MVSRIFVAGATAILIIVMARVPEAQGQLLDGAGGRRWVHLDSVSGSLPALRTTAQRVLVAEGFGVREIAACDCLIESGVLSMPSGQSMQLFIHIIKAPAMVRSRITIEAVALPPNQSGVLMSARADSLLERVRRSFGDLRSMNPQS